MPLSRFSRLEEKKQRKRLTLAVIGSVALVVFFALFGLKILVGFSLLIDSLRGASPIVPQSQSIIVPPVINPLPTATNSGALSVSGTGQQGLTVILYLNNTEIKKLTVNKSGSFSAQLKDLKEGPNTISAKLTDDKGNMSDLSNVITTSIKKSPPILEITNPQDNSTVNGDSNMVTVSGKSEDDTTITVNGRVIVLRTDNSFQYQYPLSDGDNKLTIKATDQAGNSTTVERTVKYQK